jgi:hypothetical protein
MWSLEISPDGIFFIVGARSPNSAIIYNVNVNSDLITNQKQINGNAGGEVLSWAQTIFISNS